MPHQNGGDYYTDHVLILYIKWCYQPTQVRIRKSGYYYSHFAEESIETEGLNS